MSNKDEAMRIRTKIAIKQMKAVRKLVLAFSDLLEGTHNFADDGWLDFYTYEPIDYGKRELRRIVSAITPLYGDNLPSWEFRVLGSDGSISTSADGSGETHENTVDGMDGLTDLFT